MKLKNIYALCRDNYDTISNISRKEASSNGKACSQVSGWIEARKTLVVLRDIKPLEKESNELLNSVPELYMTKDSFVVLNDEWSKILSAKNNLLRNMKYIISLYEGIGENTDERIGLDIKLPKFNDFSEFVKYINDIEFILTKCPFLQNEDEKLVFENVDIGTTWLTFFIKGISATYCGSVLLNNIAAFVDKCIVIRSHFLTTQKQKLELQAEKRNEEEKRIISQYIDDSYKKMVGAAIKDLEDATKYSVKNEDGDEIGRIEQCFEKMGILIEKGLQIKASIDSPRETQALFEPLEMKYLEIDNTIKLLDKKED